MTMAVRELQWENSYKRIVRMLPALTKKELDILGDIADEFTAKEHAIAEMRPLLKEEMYERIDHSLAQADRGEVYSLDEVMEEIDREFSL